MALDGSRQGARDAARIFGDNAVQMHHLGLAVIPLGPNRTPSVRGFNRWSRRPSQCAVEGWIASHPSDNIGVIPGLSKVWVADVDDAGQVEEMQELLGATPLRTRTNRGVHLWYAKPCERLPSTLRRFGLNVDLKSGNSIVIAPPSIHESGKSYVLDDGCDWSALDELRRPDVAKLRKFLDGLSRPKPEISRREMRDGSRKLWLNDLLCSHAMHCDTEVELLDVARTANQNLGSRGVAMLDDAIVVKRTAAVWKDAVAGKLEAWRGKSGNARARGSEIDELCRLSRNNGPDAFMLLMRLRIEHSARCRRGETFAITPKAMARDNVVPGWTRERYQKARDLLLLAGLVGKVTCVRSTADGRVAAQYRLTTHSIAGEAPITL